MPKMKLVIRKKDNGEIVKVFETVYSFRDILKNESDASQKLNRLKFYTEIVDVDCEHCDGELHPNTNICNKCGIKESVGGNE